jgi:hypothetical protein
MASTGHLSTEMLADHAEGLLREAEAAAVEAHVAACAECRAEQALLAALPGLLATDDVGPMPAAYAARIDAALAALPPLTASAPSAAPAPARAPAAATAEVVDLASRRKSGAAPKAAGRVTSVAASIVLLLGGTVLGLQALNSDGSNDQTSPVAERPQKPIETTEEDRPSAAPGRTTAPAADTAEPRRKNPEEAPPAKTGTQKPPAKGIGTTATRESAAPAASSEQRAASDATAGTQASTSKAGQEPVRAATAETDDASPAYVEDSRSTYTPENFDSKVRALVERSGYQAPAEAPAEEPAPVQDSPAADPAQNDPAGSDLAGSDPAQEAAQQDPGLRFQLASLSQPAATPGPAGAAVRKRVQKCAEQLGGQLVAGDTGVWRGGPVTVVVLADPADPARVIGHVIAGPCNDKQPATARASKRHAQPVALKP